jgi:hypothetical protein
MATLRNEKRNRIGGTYYGALFIALALLLGGAGLLQAQSPLTVQPSTGRVGVNVTNPGYSLDVSGTVNATSFRGDGSQLTNIVGGVLNKVTSNTTITGASTTEGTLYSFSVPGGTLGTNNTVRLTISGTVASTGWGPGTVTLRIKYGSTTLSAALRLNGGAGATLPWQVVIELSGDGATNAQVMHALGSVQWMQWWDGTWESYFYSGWTDNYGGNLKPVRGTATVDSTAAQNLAVTGQWSAAGGYYSLTLEYAMLEKLS